MAGKKEVDPRRSAAGRKAKARGNSFEHRVKKQFSYLGSHIYSGTSGDVVAGEYLLEAKYRTGFRLVKIDELASWIDQAKRNVKEYKTKEGQDKRWMVVFTGGGRSGMYAINPVEEIKRLHLLIQELQERLADKR